MKASVLAVLLLLVPTMAFSQRVDLPAKADDSLLEEAVARISGSLIVAGEATGEEVPESSLAHLQIATGRYRDAVETIRSVMEDLVANGDDRGADRWVPYLIFAQAGHLEAGAGKSFEDAYSQAFRDYFSAVDDLPANRAQYWFSANMERARADMETALEQQQGSEPISLAGALELARRYAFLEVYRTSEQISKLLSAEDERARYLIQDDVTFRTPAGATLSAVVVRGKKYKEPLPAALLFTIYTNLMNMRQTMPVPPSIGSAGSRGAMARSACTAAVIPDLPPGRRSSAAIRH